MREKAEHLAELHWVSYTMTARISIGPTPLWEELPQTQRDCLISAMELMLELGHVEPGY